jgi:hypothetical protein
MVNVLNRNRGAFPTAKGGAASGSKQKEYLPDEDPLRKAPGIVIGHSNSKWARLYQSFI